MSRSGLQYVVQVFRAHGCFAMSLYDLGVLPHDLRHRLGFHPSADRYVYAVRRPRRTIEPFATVQPPFLLDFT